ncbi:MAG: hypothetical protein R2729_28990 [Bryobacteraceae bacterium]
MKLRPLTLSALLLLVCAAVLLVLEFRRQDRDLSPRGLLLRLPSQEEGIQVYADIQTLRRAGLLDLLAGSRASEELDYRRFVEAVKFDYREDLDAIYGVFDGRRSNFLLEGRISWGDIRQYSEQHGARCRSGYCSLEGRAPDRVLSFYPVSPDVLSIAIDADMWGAELTAKPKPEPPGFWIPPQPFWVAVPGKVLADPGSLPAGAAAFASQLKGALRMTLAAGPSGDAFQAEMRARFQNETDAAESRANLAKATETLQAFLAREKQRANPSDMSGLLVSGSFEQEGTVVVGRWPITRAFLENLAGGNLEQ